MSEIFLVFKLELLCRKFRLNTASRNVYFEFLKISGFIGFFTRTRVLHVKLANKDDP